MNLEEATLKVVFISVVFSKRSFVLVFGNSQAWLSSNHVSHTPTMQLSVFSYLIRSGIYSKSASQLLLYWHGAGQQKVLTLLEPD